MIAIRGAEVVRLPGISHHRVGIAANFAQSKNFDYSLQRQLLPARRASEEVRATSVLLAVISP
jgi:hypothetical protein